MITLTYNAKNKIPAEWIEKLMKNKPMKLFTDQEEEQIMEFIKEYKDTYKLRDIHRVLLDQFPDLTWDMLRYRRDKITNE